jgi:hypothetical protein
MWIVLFQSRLGDRKKQSQYQACDRESGGKSGHGRKEDWKKQNQKTYEIFQDCYKPLSNHLMLGFI